MIMQLPAAFTIFAGKHKFANNAEIVKNINEWINLWP